MLLSPVAGIYISLSSSYNQSKEDKSKLVSVEDFIVSADGYESKLLKKLIEILKTEANNSTVLNIKSYFSLVNIVISLDGFVDKHYSPVR